MQTNTPRGVCPVHAKVLLGFLLETVELGAAHVHAVVARGKVPFVGASAAGRHRAPLFFHVGPGDRGGGEREEQGEEADAVQRGQSHFIEKFRLFLLRNVSLLFGTSTIYSTTSYRVVLQY